MGDPSIAIRFLDTVSFGCIHAAFQEAFADYATAAGDVPESVLYNRAVKNGLDLGLSTGAFAGRRLVGITLIGVDRFDGSPSVYDIATGIVPDYRGRGLAGRLMEPILPRLGERGIERFVLEVLRQNRPAIKAYSAAGFAVTRRFECFGLARKDFAPRGLEDPTIYVGRGERDLPACSRDWIDWHPSWENSLSSIARIPDELLVLRAEQRGQPVGLLVFYPALNWILYLATRPDLRRRGIGSRLIAELLRSTEGQDSWKLNNIVDSDAGTIAFLHSVGFRFTVGQFEMVRPV